MKQLPSEGTTEEAITAASELISQCLPAGSSVDDFVSAAEECMVDDDLHTLVAKFNELRPMTKSASKRLKKKLDNMQKRKQKVSCL